MVSNQTLYGAAHEYLVAEQIIQHSDKAYFGTDDDQQRLMLSRRNYVNQLTPTKFNQLNTLATNSARQLPQAVGAVNFVKTAANGGYVYDLIYTATDGIVVPVSCKLSSMEDKAYRFNAADYRFPNIVEWLRTVFTPTHVTNGSTFLEALTDVNLTVRAMQRRIVTDLQQSIIDEDADGLMMLTLLSERFIGHGGYYKTVKRGDLLYYPVQENTDYVSIDKDTLTTTPTSLKFAATLYNEQNEVKQEYLIAFRVKFKDGVNKPVRLSEDGAPANVAATVKLTLV